MRLLAMSGDILHKLGWTEPPITNFRLNNMLTGTHYPIEKTEEAVEEMGDEFEDFTDGNDNSVEDAVDDAADDVEDAVDDAADEIDDRTTN